MSLSLTPRMPAPITLYLNSIAATTPELYLFEEDINPRLRSRFADKLAKELRELIEICCQNLLHAQELQKRAHNKRVKSCSYAPDEKVWLNSKYIKTKRLAIHRMKTMQIREAMKGKKIMRQGLELEDFFREK